MKRSDMAFTGAPAGRQSGVVLINVLAIIALASSVAYMMITLQGTAIHRSQRFSEAAQAAAYARGGEASAIVALRRDAIEAPDVDHYLEPWAALAETQAPIGNGTFSLAIEDAQSRFNVNSLERGGALALRTLEKIAVALDVPAGVAQRIADRIATSGPIDRLEALRDTTLEAASLARLSPWVTALPGRTKVNLNSASEALLSVLLDNPVAARVLVSRRKRQGFLTPEDVRKAGVLLPPGVGYTSSYFTVSVTVRLDGTTQRLTSLLARRQLEGRPVVVSIARQRGVAASY